MMDEIRSVAAKDSEDSTSIWTSLRACAAPGLNIAMEDLDHAENGIVLGVLILFVARHWHVSMQIAESPAVRSSS